MLSLYLATVQCISENVRVGVAESVSKTRLKPLLSGFVGREAGVSCVLTNTAAAEVEWASCHGKSGTRYSTPDNRFCLSNRSSRGL
jgi:hypothetical protein